jgi:hydroxyacylglutathione hydrolase
MYFKKVFMEDSGSLSYIIGCVYEGTACVVNPKRYVRDYLNTAKEFDMKITHIFDTRESEGSYLNGNMELMLRTGAKIHYLNKEAFQLNREIAVEGDVFNFGHARLEIIESPCHDLFAGTIRVTDTSSTGEPWIILGRESLFVGDLADSDLRAKDLSEELLCYLDMHEEYCKPSSMVEPICENLSGIERDNPVYASSF